MKISFVLIFACILQISATTYSQNARIDLAVSNMKVKDVLKIIESKTNFRFFYNDDLSELDRTLSLSSSQENVVQVLGQIFASSKVSFKILENNVVVIAPSVSLQQQKISGTLTDATTNDVLVGVTIIIEGTTKGTTTDQFGKYTLDVPSGATLIFSYIGYNTEKVTTAGQSVLDLTLIPDIQALDEVVVIGYGTVKKRDLTGSVSSLKKEDIIKSPTHNVMEAIQGKVAGVDITRSSGEAGSGVNISVRGNRSISGSNKPLFIIDGIQGASYEDLNTSDIESIEVLKDASSTAIYGSQGANGVIIVTTKKGAEGKTKVNYDGFIGINGLTPYPKSRTGEDYINLRREAYRTTGNWSSKADDAKLWSNTEEQQAAESGKWVDWLDLLIQNGIQQSHKISVSGGNEKTKMYLSAGYFSETGMVKGDDMTRYTVRLNIDHSINNWAKVGVKSQITYYNTNRRKDPLSYANQILPLGTAYNADGTINLYPIAGSPTDISPLTDERGEQISKNNYINSITNLNTYLEITPIKGLSVKTVLSVNLANEKHGEFYDITSLTSFKGDKKRTAKVSNAMDRFINWDNIIAYSKDIDEHTFSITALTSYSKGITDNLSASGTNQALASQLEYSLYTTEATSRLITSGYVQKQTFSFAGRVNYSFKGKYLFTASNRVDYSSVLSPGFKNASFPSIAVAWRMGDESFLSDMPQINNLKLRLSYGISGNSGVDPYGTQSLIVNKGMTLGNNTSASAYQFSTRIGNKSLGWEKSATTNIGIDLGLFKNKIEFIIDAYKTKTTDILLARTLPLSTGVTDALQNVGASLNKGIEIVINTENIKSKNFRWTTTFTFATNKEEITKLIDGKNIINASNPEDNSLLLNHPINSFYTYKKLGIWQKGEEAEMAKIKNVTYAPGDIKLANIDAVDTIIDANDRTYIGSKVPDWVAGLQNSFFYKGFDFNVYIFARWGQMIDAEILGRYNPSGTGNGPEQINYWTPENPTNDFPRPKKGQNLINYYGYQTLTYVDGSYFKVKNITLGYTLPKVISNKLNITNLRLYATASNLFTFAKSHLIKDYDPERGGSESSPLTRQIIFGVNVEF